MKLWDLETILEGSNENLGNASGAAGGSDSDDDNEEMDLDDSPPKPSKGKKRNLQNFVEHFETCFWDSNKCFLFFLACTGTNRKTKSKPNRVDTTTNFFADL